MLVFGQGGRATGAPVVVAIGGSAEGLAPLRDLLAQFPDQLPAAVVIALHLPPRRQHVSKLPNILQAAIGHHLARDASGCAPLVRRQPWIRLPAIDLGLTASAQRIGRRSVKAHAMA